MLSRRRLLRGLASVCALGPLALRRPVEVEEELTQAELQEAFDWVARAEHHGLEISDLTLARISEMFEEALEPVRHPITLFVSRELRERYREVIVGALGMWVPVPVTQDPLERYRDRDLEYSGVPVREGRARTGTYVSVFALD